MPGLDCETQIDLSAVFVCDRDVRHDVFHGLKAHTILCKHDALAERYVGMRTVGRATCLISTPIAICAKACDRHERRDVVLLLLLSGLNKCDFITVHTWQARRNAEATLRDAVGLGISDSNVHRHIHTISF